MKPFRNTAVLLLAIALSACGHSDCQGLVSGQLVFRGFDSAALETVMVIFYPGGSGFRYPIDTMTWRLSDSRQPLQHYDSVNGWVTWPYVAPVVEGQEVRVAVPGAGKVYEIKDLASTNAKSKYANSGGSKSGDVCYDALAAYTLDGTRVVTGASPSYGGGNSVDIVLER